MSQQTEEKSNQIEWRPAALDGLLGALAFWCNKGAKISITISANGMLISGLLVGYDEYIQHFLSTLKESGVEEIVSAFSQGLEPSPVHGQLPHFIHIKNARFFLANGQPIDPSSTPVWWRGRIDQIDGFFLGEIP